MLELTIQLGVWWAEINEVATSSGSSYGWERRRSPPRVRLWGGGIIEQLKLQNTAVVKNVPAYIRTKNDILIKIISRNKGVYDNKTAE